MATIEELEARIVELEKLVGQKPADIVADTRFPTVWSTPHVKFEHRSGILCEKNDPPELAFRRRNISELWNAEHSGAASNAPSTVGIIYSQPYGTNGDYDTPELPGNPGPSRTAQIALKVKGVPSSMNRRGQVVLSVNRGTELREVMTLDCDGSIRYGHTNEKFVEFGTADLIGTGDWRELHNVLGSLIVLNLSYGIAAGYAINARGLVSKLWGHDEMGVGPGNGIGVYVNYDWQSARYQLINRYSDPVVLAWKHSGLNVQV